MTRSPQPKYGRRPSVASVAALMSACGKPIATAAVPTGKWLEHDASLPGYRLNQLLLAFEDLSSLLISSSTLMFGPEPWQETFVLDAVSVEPMNAPLDQRNAGASRGFTVAPPLQAVFGGQSIASPELFVCLSDAYPNDEENYLPAESLRIRVGQHAVEFWTEVRVEPWGLAVCCSGFPVFNTAATGERSWLSSAANFVGRAKPSSGEA